MNFNGAARRLDNVDLPKIAAEIGCGEDEIHAILDVEAAGSGFDAAGRPKMLFEPHRFYRNLTGAQREIAVQLGLAYETWGTKPYPADSYPQLMHAMEVNETAALISCSWGLGQIMGEHHAALNYKTVQDMVLAFADDEEAQLQGLIDFVKTEHLDDELRSHNWASFARGYNGAGYARNRYDIKLAASFAKWRAIKDTPFILPSIPKTATAPQIAHPAPVQAIPVPPAIMVSKTTTAPVAPNSEAPMGFWKRLFSIFKPRPVGNRIISGESTMNGSKTFMFSSAGIMSVLFTAISTFATAGNVQMAMAIFGGAIAATFLFFAQMAQRSAVGKIALNVADQIAVAFETNQNALVSALAKAADEAIQKAQAEAVTGLIIPPKAP